MGGDLRPLRSHGAHHCDIGPAAVQRDDGTGRPESLATVGKEKAYLLVLEAGIRWLHRIEALGQSGGPGQRHQPVPILQASGAGIEERSAIELYGEDQSAVVFRLGKPGMVQNRLAAQVIEDSVYIALKGGIGFLRELPLGYQGEGGSHRQQNDARDQGALQCQHVPGSLKHGLAPNGSPRPVRCRLPGRCPPAGASGGRNRRNYPDFRPPQGHLDPRPGREGPHG